MLRSEFIGALGLARIGSPPVVELQPGTSPLHPAPAEAPTDPGVSAEARSRATARDGSASGGGAGEDPRPSQGAAPYRGGTLAPTLSVVVPCHNEQQVIAETYRRLCIACDRIHAPYELIFVDDGSSDGTRQVLERLHASDARVRVVCLSRNFGQQTAVTAGIHQALGSAVVLIDADLQDPPELIPAMFSHWQDGVDVVYAVRRRRAGESWFKRASSYVFYRLLNRLSDVAIPADTGDFRLMDRRVVESVAAMPERDRFLRGMIAWVGFRQLGLPYDRDPRYAGDSKFPLRRLLALSIDGLLSFSVRPLRLAVGLGFAASALAVLGIIYALVIRLATSSWVSGWAFLTICILFMGGVQLACLGIIGEYLGRVHAEVKRRPLYLIDRLLGARSAGAGAPASVEGDARLGDHAVDRHGEHPGADAVDPLVAPPGVRPAARHLDQREMPGRAVRTVRTMPDEAAAPPISATAALLADGPAATGAPARGAGSLEVPGWLHWGAIVCASIGLLWREWWVLVAHRPERSIYSDMANYCHLATNLARGGYQQTASDAFQAQGFGLVLAFWRMVSGDWTAATWASLVVCLATPLLIAWLAYQLAGARVAWIALIIASLHFPFIDYGGYFLAETPFTALLVLGVGLLVYGLSRPSLTAMAVWTAASGLALGLAACLKSHGLLVAAAFALWLGYRALRRRSAGHAVASLALGLTAILAVLPMCLRTSALIHHPGFISTCGPLNVLIGHSDPKISVFRFITPGGVERWGCPSAWQRGGTQTFDCHFAASDGPRCLAMAWSWLRQHPIEGFITSCDHVIELYSLRTYPWPSISTAWRLWTIAAEHITLIAVTIPAAFAAGMLWTRRQSRERQVVTVLLLPILCLWVTVFLTSSEPRYRVPFDAFTIILAAMLYARLPFGRSLAAQPPLTAATRST